VTTDAEFRPGGARARFFAWLDRVALHPELRDGGPDLRRRAHLAIVFATLSGLGAVLLGINHLLYGVAIEGLLFIGFGIAAGVVMRMLRRTGSLVLVGNVVAFLWLAGMIVSTGSRGGLMSHGVMGAAAVPVVAVVLAGRRSGWFWCLMTFGLIVTLYVLGLAGVELEDQAPAAAREHIAVISALLFALVMFLMASAHEAMKSAAITELARTERAKVEAEAEAKLHEADRLAAVGRLSSAVAHEINNPLSYIIGNLDFVRQELAEGGSVDREALDEALADALEGAEQVRKVVRDLNSFARTTDEVSNVDVRTAIESAARMAGHQIRHRARLRCDVDISAAVLVNDGRLAQVLLNLLVNAAQAIPVGRADRNDIVIRAYDRDPYVAVEVEDTGVGIPRDILHRVTEPFFTTKAVGEGTGLGLAVCKNLVERIGGRMEIESTAGVGTTVRLLLPSAARPALAPTRRQPRQRRRPVNARRILVVDDDARVLRFMQRTLAGHEVTVAANGRQAIEALERPGRFDLVLCDLMMPDIPGAEVYERIRRSHPELVERFVLVTGGAFSDEAEAFLARFPGRVVRKPFCEQELRALVEHRHEAPQARAELYPSVPPAPALAV
jgi:signal transduction histidine kinase/CheY-like chemotaxis protein